MDQFRGIKVKSSNLCSPVASVNKRQYGMRRACLTPEIDEEDGGSEGSMSEHLQRYRKYIDSLKEGRSSGISSVFGRASDLLPPDVLEIKPPTMVAERLET